MDFQILTTRKDPESTGVMMRPCKARPHSTTRWKSAPGPARRSFGRLTAAWPKATILTSKRAAMPPVSGRHGSTTPTRFCRTPPNASAMTRRLGFGKVLQSAVAPPQDKRRGNALVQPGDRGCDLLLFDLWCRTDTAFERRRLASAKASSGLQWRPPPCWCQWR